MKRSLLALCCALLPAAVPAANEAIRMEGTTIIGNRELPKVLYIVPWKQARPGEMVVRPFSTLYDQALAPVDREVLRRQINYFKALEKTTTHSQPSKE
ncbi:MAG TPA: hypothetical protein ENK48_01835 [Gammaproteobacteria bacterium]|nr:hypothetical protein [Gammaproteobacteria bacterium]